MDLCIIIGIFCIPLIGLFLDEHRYNRRLKYWKKYGHKEYRRKL